MYSTKIISTYHIINSKINYNNKNIKKAGKWMSLCCRLGI